MTKSFTKEEIAHVVHEANRALQSVIGDPGVPVSPPWADAPEDQVRSSINGIKFTFDNPDVTPEQSHESWLAEKLENGWVWGPVKDAELKTHPNIKPYSEIPAAEKIKDHLFLAIVRTLGSATK